MTMMRLVSPLLIIITLSLSSPLLSLFVFVDGCTTLAAGRLATHDGSILAAHSNDGDTTVAANLIKVEHGDWPTGSMRQVSGGQIPQVPHTFAYFTKPGGYASLNEHQVGLAESTCTGRYSPSTFTSSSSSSSSSVSHGILNIVDLSAIALERSRSARSAISTMGTLATSFGYFDNAESLLVVDTTEVWIFHILMDSTSTSAIWAAQKLADDDVTVVANAFVLRTINTSDSETFLASANLMSEAKRLGWDPSVRGRNVDFTRVFADREAGHQYASGRRMWHAFSRLSNLPPASLSPTYVELVSASPYPVAAKSRGNLTLDDFFATMRSWYAGTSYDMSSSSSSWALSGGAFQTPDRFITSSGAVKGNWERTITTSRSILSYVLQIRPWLPNNIGGVLWFAPHAAHTSLYTPFPLAIPDTASLPAGFTQNSMDQVGRGVAAWQAARFVFNIVQLRFVDMMADVQQLQHDLELRSQQLQQQIDAEYLATHNVTHVIEQYVKNAVAGMSEWWQLSDTLILHYADGTCHSCGRSISNYPEWWLKHVGYEDGPPPSPPVPPL